MVTSRENLSSTGSPSPPGQQAQKRCEIGINYWSRDVLILIICDVLITSRETRLTKTTVRIYRSRLAKTAVPIFRSRLAKTAVPTSPNLPIELYTVKALSLSGERKQKQVESSDADLT
jgi:hypothetical protein